MLIRESPLNHSYGQELANPIPSGAWNFSALRVWPNFYPGGAGSGRTFRRATSKITPPGILKHIRIFISALQSQAKTLGGLCDVGRLRTQENRDGFLGT